MEDRTVNRLRDSQARLTCSPLGFPGVVMGVRARGVLHKALFSDQRTEAASLLCAASGSLLSYQEHRPCTLMTLLTVPPPSPLPDYSTKSSKTRHSQSTCPMSNRIFIAAVRIGEHHLATFYPLESSHQVTRQSRGCEQERIYWPVRKSLSFPGGGIEALTWGQGQRVLQMWRAAYAKVLWQATP